jgi:hypothetical protein
MLLAIEPDPDSVFSPDDMIGGDNQAILRPQPASCREPLPAFHPYECLPQFLNRIA